MCGGNLQVAEGQSYGTCDSCGTTMTIPKTVDERILNLFNRANDYRLNNEFDKALATYESILSEDNTNAEAHWGCVISKYGIEYVEDPATHKRIPTCHRVQSTSILVDLEYKKALEYADESSKELYTKEATEISEIQKRILAIAIQEEAYDIFICYKETDEYGKRTMDSALAQDIYFQLQNEGYKVFFSRITLEDKLGQEYEPYIFAALNSAKVMLVVGTKPEYYNAVWVKNEWSRFLALAKKDNNKLLVPCYRDMDAYDLPDELSMFQSQDMSKIGFIQDLIHGIKKVLTTKKEETPAISTPQQPEFDFENIIVMAKTSLDTGNWREAIEYANSILNRDAKHGDAWFVKMKAIELQLKSEDYSELRLKELFVCGNKAIELSADPMSSGLEEQVKLSYEKTLEGYIKKWQSVINSTQQYFGVGWGALQYVDLQANIQKVKEVYSGLAEASEYIKNTPKTTALLTPLYNVLRERLEFSKQRLSGWRPQYRDEQANENRFMSDKFDIIETNISKLCPDIIKQGYIDQYNILHQNTEKAREKIKKSDKAYGLASAISGGIGLFFLMIGLMSGDFWDNIALILITAFGLEIALICLIAWPIGKAQNKSLLKKSEKAEADYIKLMANKGIRVNIRK